MTAQYFVFHVVPNEDVSDMLVDDYRTPRTLSTAETDEKLPSLTEFCAERGLSFIGWHPTLTALGVFRKD